MTITVPIPMHLMEQLENFTLECSGLSRNEIVFPPHSLALECRELLECSAQFFPASHRFIGPIYVNIKEATITGACVPKGAKYGR